MVSGDLGFRKPDPRRFAAALHGLGMEAGEALFMGNDMFRDGSGAKQAGLRTLCFSSNQRRNRSNRAEPDDVKTPVRKAASGKHDS